MMTDPSEFVTISNSTLVTDSRRVAKHFRRQHKNVLRAYDRLDCSEEFNRLNFEPVEDLDEKGEMRRIVRMTKNGFMFLAMGLTGKEAARIKETYIGAFDALAEQLQQMSLGLWEQRLALEKRDANSFALASFGSRCMNQRKRDLPGIRSDRIRLADQMQPALFAGIGFSH